MEFHKSSRIQGDHEGTYAWLDCDNTAGRNFASQTEVPENLIRVLAVVVAAGVVGIHAQVVSQPVREEGLADTGVEDFVLVTLEDAKRQEAVDGDLVSKDVKVIPHHAGLDGGNAFLLHLVCNFVNLP